MFEILKSEEKRLRPLPRALSSPPPAESCYSNSVMNFTIFVVKKPIDSAYKQSKSGVNVLQRIETKIWRFTSLSAREQCLCMRTCFLCTRRTCVCSNVVACSLIKQLFVCISEHMTQQETNLHVYYDQLQRP